MIDITHKVTSLRVANAQAIVRVSKQNTIDAIVNKQVPKGDVFEMAKTAGLFGVKQTALLIPDCHPLPIEYTGIEFSINGLEITIDITVKTIYRTGVEVEAMHGVSIVALTMYDMLKPIDKGVEIKNIKLIKKTGGKSDFNNVAPDTLKVSSIVCSNLISDGKKENNLTPMMEDKMNEFNLSMISQVVSASNINSLLESLNTANNSDLVLIAGGTGLSKDDISYDAIANYIDFEIPGIGEYMRSYGQERTPKAFVSRSIVGVKNNSLIILMPGSTQGLKESLDCLFPYVFYAYKSLNK